jgi:alpha-1,3/alpha-1,6-mannosyltransferase
MAFSQTKDGTLPVEVHGNFFPRLICGKFHAFCETIRMTFCALWLIFFGPKYDLIILDQIPFPLPFLCIKYKTLFYCHHPDKVLCTDRRGILKKIYRFFIDSFEEITMCFAHRIVVNSLYTREIYLKNFKILKKLRNLPEVIYPSIDLHTYDRKEETKKEDLFKIKGLEKLKEKNIDVNKMKLIVSLNRYEEKKNLDLAVLSYIDYVSKYVNKSDINNSCLVIAGGYDTFLQENIDVYNKLNSYIDTPEKKSMNIFFLKNISNEERSILFRTANIVLYTPKFEHFGIVPLEAMYCGAWVLASKTGGPMESVVDGKTGNLLDNELAEKWSEKIKEMLENKKNLDENNYMNSKELKSILKKHVEDNFSLNRMYTDLYTEVQKMFKDRKLKDD